MSFKKRQHSSLISTTTENGTFSIEDFVSTMSLVDDIDTLDADYNITWKIRKAYESKLRTLLLQNILDVKSDETHFKKDTVEDLEQQLSELTYNRIREKWKLLESKFTRSNLDDKLTRSNLDELKPQNLIQFMKITRSPGQRMHILNFLCESIKQELSFYDDFLILWEYAIELSYLLRLWFILAFDNSGKSELDEPIILPVQFKRSLQTTVIASHAFKSHVMLSLLLAGQHLKFDWRAVTYDSSLKESKWSIAFTAWHMVSFYSEFRSIIPIHNADLEMSSTGKLDCYGALERRILHLVGEELSLKQLPLTCSLFHLAKQEKALRYTFNVFARCDWSNFLYALSEFDQYVDQYDTKFIAAVNERRIKFRRVLLEQLIDSNLLHGGNTLWNIVLSFYGNLVTCK